MAEVLAAHADDVAAGFETIFADAGTTGFQALAADVAAPLTLVAHRFQPRLAQAIAAFVQALAAPGATSRAGITQALTFLADRLTALPHSGLETVATTSATSLTTIS